MSTRPDLHSDSGIQTYVDGMNASSSDKARILEWLVPGTVVELGCGDGVVLEHLRNSREGTTSITGIDSCARLLGRAASRWFTERDQDDIPVTLKRLDLLHSDVPGHYDNVVCCSFLHEIYSVFARTSEKYKFWLWFNERCLKALNPGGRLIIRDGIRPRSERVRLGFNHGAAKSDFYRFADDFDMDFIEFDVDPKTDDVMLDSVAVYEFATKYFYNENWAIELQECFGWADFKDLKTYINGFDKKYRVVTKKAYCLPYLRDKWANDLVLKDVNGNPYEMPSTMLYVVERL